MAREKKYLIRLLKGERTRGGPVTGTQKSEKREVPLIPSARRLLERIRADRPEDPPEAAIFSL